jgi:hypothetical protein
MVSGHLRIESNGTLTSFSLDSLSTVSSDGYFYIYDNYVLCQSLVDAFVDAITALGWVPGGSWEDVGLPSGEDMWIPYGLFAGNDESC